MKRLRLNSSIPFTGLIIMVLAAMLCLAPWAGTVSGAEIEIDESAGKVERNGLGFHFQAGYFHRFNDSHVAPDKAKFMITGDVSLLNHKPGRTSWGLGLHMAVDDDGNRFGPRAIWRLSLGDDGMKFFQLAPTVYLGGTDNSMLLKLPGYALEAEFGFSNFVSLVMAVESLPFENRYLGYDPDLDPYTDPDLLSNYEDSGTAVSGYLGGKLGQVPGLMAVLGLMGILAIAFSQSSM